MATTVKEDLGMLWDMYKGMDYTDHAKNIGEIGKEFVLGAADQSQEVVKDMAKGAAGVVNLGTYVGEKGIDFATNAIEGATGKNVGTSLSKQKGAFGKYLEGLDDRIESVDFIQSQLDHPNNEALQTLSAVMSSPGYFIGPSGILGGVAKVGQLSKGSKLATGLSKYLGSTKFGKFFKGRTNTKILQKEKEINKLTKEFDKLTGVGKKAAVSSDDMKWFEGVKNGTIQLGNKANINKFNKIKESLSKTNSPSIEKAGQKILDKIDKLSVDRLNMLNKSIEPSKIKSFVEQQLLVKGDTFWNALKGTGINAKNFASILNKNPFKVVLALGTIGGVTAIGLDIEQQYADEERSKQKAKDEQKKNEDKKTTTTVADDNDIEAELEEGGTPSTGRRGDASTIIKLEYALDGKDVYWDTVGATVYIDNDGTPITIADKIVSRDEADQLEFRGYEMQAR